jgi:hypothetical protein
VDLVDWWDLDEVLKLFEFIQQTEPSYVDYRCLVGKSEAIALQKKYRHRAFEWRQDRVEALDQLLARLDENGQVELLIYEWESGF